jgi:hypothetical protein
MTWRYESGAIRTLADLAGVLEGSLSPVLLLEGTRSLPFDLRPVLAALGRLLAERLPSARFRSGNAEGTDTAFAEGVAAVAPDRMEYVITHAGMGRKRRVDGCRVVTLADLPSAAEEVMANVTLKTTPSTGGLIEAYRADGRRTALGAKGAYLVRDTLKVVGDPANGLAPATAGLFFVKEADPLSGGTGHTIRVCLEHGVPVVTQAVWLRWR